MFFPWLYEANAIRIVDRLDAFKQTDDAGDETLLIHIFSNHGAFQFVKLKPLLVQRGYSVKKLVLDSTPGQLRFSLILQAAFANVNNRLIRIALQYLFVPILTLLLVRRLKLHLLSSLPLLLSFRVIDKWSSGLTEIYFGKMKSAVLSSSAPDCLFLYSQIDCLCEDFAIENFMAKLKRATPAAIHCLKFDNSGHIQHLKRNKAKYKSSLKHFLSSTRGSWVVAFPESIKMCDRNGRLGIASLFSKNVCRLWCRLWELGKSRRSCFPLSGFVTQCNLSFSAFYRPLNSMCGIEDAVSFWIRLLLGVALTRTRESWNGPRRSKCRTNTPYVRLTAVIQATIPPHTRPTPWTSSTFACSSTGVNTAPRRGEGRQRKQCRKLGGWRSAPPFSWRERVRESPLTSARDWKAFTYLPLLQLADLDAWRGRGRFGRPAPACDWQTVWMTDDLPVTV